MSTAPVLTPDPIATSSRGARLRTGFAISWVLCLVAATLIADDGDFDVTFSGDGLVTTIFDDTADLARDVVIQPDGKIVVVGRTDLGSGDAFAIARYLANGDLDPSFSGDGKDIQNVGLGDDEAWSVAIQNNGKIVVAGCTLPDAELRLGILRYNANGTLDATFDSNGVLFGPSGSCAHGVALQDDGKIVVAGYGDNGNSILTARYSSTGVLDGSFSTDGLDLVNLGTTEQAWDVAVQDDGKIVVAGCSTIAAVEQIVLLRYSSTGVLDTTFDGDGVVVTDVSGANDCAYALALQEDGKPVIAGSADSDTWALLSRYTSSGALDTTFSGDGTDLTRPDSGNSGSWGVALHTNGRIVVTGGTVGAEERLFVQRYLPTGALDTTFGSPNGYVTHNWGAFYAFGNAVAIADGRAVVTGHLGSMSGPVFATSRYLSGLIFADGFESGNTDAWSAAVP